MKVQVEEISPIERKLSIEVESSRVADELSRAYNQLGRQVKVAGFRPGKVPRRILEQRFREEVEGDVIKRVVERAYFDAIREHKVEAVSNPMVTNGGLKADEPFRFEARVEVKPKLDPKDYTGLALKKPKLQVEDAQINEQLESIQKNMTRIEPVNGRDVAAANDYALVDFTATSDGKEFQGSKNENVTVEVAPGELINSKIAALEGVKVGDTKELDYAFPADYRVEAVQGKTARFKIQLKGLKTKIVPELNDALAKEVGGGETLEELKGKIRADLERSLQQQAEQDQRDELIKQLVAKNPFEVPNAMVDRAISLMLEGALRQMARSGVDLEKLGLDFEKLREEMRPKALSEVQGALLFEAVAEKEKLTASDEDVQKKIESLAGELGQPVQKLQKHFKNPEERRGLLSRVLEQKTVEFLKGSATYSES